jgi:hypothetical protein
MADAADVTEVRPSERAFSWAVNSDLSIYIWSKNFSHSAYEKSEAKMAAIDVQ